MNRFILRLVAVAGAFATAIPFASGLSAQTQVSRAFQTRVEGYVLSTETGRPVPNVQLRFDSGHRVTSDADGRYVITGVPAGLHRVALVTSYCQVTFADLELVSGEIKRVEFQVPPDERSGPSQDDVKRNSSGSYYTRADLQEMRVSDLIEVLRRVAPDMVGGRGGQPGARVALVGRTRTAVGAVSPVVVFDGVVVADPVAALRDANPVDIYSLEILRGATGGWAYGTGGSGGVIRVETKGGMEAFGVSDPDRCEIGRWPGEGASS